MPYMQAEVIAVHIAYWIVHPNAMWNKYCESLAREAVGL